MNRLWIASLLLCFVSTGLADTVKPPPTKQVFEDIYRSAKWGTNTKGDGHSGTGSTAQSTLLYRTFLQQFLKDNKIRSVVDAGCGDWEFSSLLDWTGIDYKGYDIVDAVVAANTKKYAKPNIVIPTQPEQLANGVKLQDLHCSLVAKTTEQLKRALRTVEEQRQVFRSSVEKLNAFSNKFNGLKRAAEIIEETVK